MTNLRGRKLGKYDVVERIASGGMAEVYKAFQPGVERFVAIKVMHSHLAQADDFVQRFQREARGVGRLLHPHILRLIDFDVDVDLYYMVMEYIPGGTLRSYLNTQQLLPIEEALRITAQLADALSYAHQQGMVHRDIKPGNVMFADETHQHAVLTDFGIARLLDDTEARLTLPGAVFGTPSYMSPEALRGETVDARSDLYSLGVILYEMVTGQRPYVADTPYSLLIKLTKEPLTPPRKLNPALPDALQKLIIKVLEKEPSKRFQSAAEFGAAIKQLQADLLVRSARGAFPFQRQSTTKRQPTTPAVHPKTPMAQPVPPKGIDAAPPVHATHWRRMVQIALGVLIMVGLVTVVLLNWAQQPWSTPLPTLAQGPNNDNITTIAMVDPSSTPLPSATAPPATALPATPTTQPPTLTSTTTPSPTPTLSPTATQPPAPDLGGANATILAVLPPPLGVLRLQRNADANGFALDLGPVKSPPAGSHYELWLRAADMAPLNLGVLPVVQGEISVTGSQDNLLATYDQAIITLERDDDPATMANTVVFTSQWPTNFTTLLRRLLVDDGVTRQGLLPGAIAQIRLAFAQSALLQEAVANADLVAAQETAEGIFKILEGDQTSVTGAPKDDAGFGIGPYLAAMHEQLLLASQITATAELAFHSQEAAALVKTLQPVAETAAIQAQQLMTAATVAAAQPLASELQRLLAILLNGVDQDGNGLLEPWHGEGGIQAADMLVRALAQYPFGDKPLTLGGASADTLTLSADAPMAVGSFWFSEEALTAPPTAAAQAPQFRFTLLLAAVAQPPDGHHYELWLAGAENEAPQHLGRLPVNDGYGRLAGQLAQNPFSNAGSILISVHADTEATPEQIGAIFYGSANQRDELHGGLRQLLSTEEGADQGLLLGLRTQMWQAHARIALMQEALRTDNMDQVRSYAEYIVHALNGKAGYGDLDGDGQLQQLENPMSASEYLQSARKATGQLAPLTTASARTRFYRARALATYDHSLDLIEQATAKAIQIFAADTIADVQPVVDELAQLLTLALYGDDRDGDGVIDPLADEGAILALLNQVAQLGEYTIYRLAPSAQGQ